MLSSINTHTKTLSRLLICVMPRTLRVQRAENVGIRMVDENPNHHKAKTTNPEVGRRIQIKAGLREILGSTWRAPEINYKKSPNLI